MPMTEKEVLFSTLAQSSPDCIKLFDTKGKLIFMNEGGLKEHGYKNIEEALKGDYLGTMLPESQEAFRAAFAAALVGDSSSMEAEHTKEGSNREWCLEMLTPIQDLSGEISGVMGISRDITHRKKMEEELQEKVDDLEKANRLMVGRELKMIELKGEIEELRRQAAAL
ncbi:MAG: PAS domain S-box protein [Minisyncoccia bacterium]